MMDGSKVAELSTYYANRHTDELLQLSAQRDTLTDDALCALERVLASRGMTNAQISEPNPPHETVEPVTKRFSWGSGLQVLGIWFVGSIFANVLAKNTPHWIGLLITIGFAGYLLYRFSAKLKK